MSRSSELWRRVERQAGQALAAGALHRIDTTAIIREDAGVAFVVRRAVNLARKAVAAKEEGDPFMRPEPALFVADLSATHYALLNKFNVLDRHLLVVTRDYVDQEARLDLADFDALAQCLGDEPVLGFYNGGRDAGASQPHKHLQVVRLPLSPREAIPMESLVRSTRRASLPFRHAFATLEREGDPARRARMLLASYRDLLEAARVGERDPYNLLVTHDWMLVVPRSAESFDGIEVNSLAFAGALFVKDEAGLRIVEERGPMAVLRGVAQPKD